MRIFKKIFGTKKQEVLQPLAVDGIPPAPITMEPDDAELAAQALLEIMSASSGSPNNARKIPEEHPLPTESRSRLAYYQALAERIRDAHRASIIRTTRFLAFCEHELQNQYLPREGKGSLGQMEAELYKRIDVINHAGGELKIRWQHCLAEVTVRLMDTTNTQPDVKQE